MSQDITDHAVKHVSFPPLPLPALSPPPPPPQSLPSPLPHLHLCWSTLIISSTTRALANIDVPGLDTVHCWSRVRSRVDWGRGGEGRGQGQEAHRSTRGDSCKSAHEIPFVCWSSHWWVPPRHCRSSSQGCCQGYKTGGGEGVWPRGWGSRHASSP